MKNKVIILSLVMMARLGFGQSPTWPSIGTIWYYENDATSYVQGGNINYNINYIKYECTKDSIYESILIKIISVSGMSNGGYGIDKSKMFIKQDGQRLDYKFKDDLNWFYFSHLNYEGVTTFSGFIRETSTNIPFTTDPQSSVIFKNEGSFLTSLNGQTFQTQSVSVENTTINTVLTIGGKGTFYPFIYRLIDVYGFSSIRCFNNQNLDLQFSERSCNYKRQELVSSLVDNDKKIIKSKLSIYPNIIKDESQLNIKINNIIENGYYIIYNQNIQSKFEGEFNGTEIKIPKDLSQGIYYIKILINNNIYYEKFIKI